MNDNDNTTLSPPTCVTVSALRDDLSQKLPTYMIPAAFVWVDALPLTPNRKVDRNALAARAVQTDMTLLSAQEPFAPPRTPTERALRAIWCEVLGVKAIGIHDNFFLIGGHSLLATQVVARIRRDWQVELPLHHLFSTPTVAGLAEQIEKIQINQVLQGAITEDGVARDEITL